MNYRYVLVTGSTRGIGRAIGIALIHQGFHVVFTGRDKKALDCLQREYGEKCIPLQIDFCENNFLERIRDRFHQIDALPEIIIHNVGMRVSSDTQPLNYSALMESIHINLGVAVEINSYFIPLMLEEQKNNRGGGGKK